MAVNSVTNTPSQAAATTAKKQSSVTDYQDMLGRIGNIPDLEQYEGAIRRMISGESEMEDPNKPLTEDQLLMRKLKREYQKTNPLTESQQAAVLQRDRRAFFEYWKKNGDGGPRPANIVLPDGTIKTFKNKAEQYDFQKSYDESFIRKVLSVIEERKAEREEKAAAMAAKKEKYDGKFDVSV